jgi:putative membrane protein
MTSETEPRRLHPAAILVEAIANSLQMLGTVVVLVVVNSGRGVIVLVVVSTLGGIAVSAYIGYRRWASTTYWLDDVALHYRAGVFTPDTKLVPRTRVQAVDTSTGVLQRLFGVVEVRVQVAGASDDDEIVLTAVTHEEAARLRRALGQPEPRPPDERVRLGIGGLLLAALTGPQIAAAASAVGAGYALVDNAVDFQDGEGLLESLDTTGEILLAAGVVLGGAYLLSFVAGVVLFAGFEAERDAGVLRIRRGLLAKRGLSIPLDRIDGVVLVEGLVRGPLGLASLQLETVSHGSGKAIGRTLLPLVRRNRAEDVIARLVPALAVAPGTLERPPARALRRFMLPPAVAGAVAGAVPGIVLGGVAWAALPALVAVGALIGLRAYRAAGVRIADGVVVVREARRARRTLFARSHRLQAHAVERTPLQERARLADLRVVVGSGGHGRARHLERGTADTLFGALRRRPLSSGS